jgi:hypothetical protein
MVNKVKNHFKVLGQDTDPWAANASSMADFNQVLAHLGIKEHQLQDIIRGLTVQIFIFKLLGCYGVYLLLFSSFATAVQGFFLAILGLVTVTCKFWRLQVLSRRKFTFFKR